MANSRVRQIWIINGGEVANSYEEYLASLKAQERTLDDLRGKGWKYTLGSALGPSFEVFNPRMPTPQNAKYNEWKIYFETLIPLMTPGVIIIGHSLGGTFLAKYLAEESFPQTIAKTILVAPAYQTPQDPYGDFNLLGGLDRFAEQGGKIVIFQSEEDYIVPYAHALHYQKALPQAQLITLHGKGHFLDETFPELVTLLLENN